MEIRYTSESLRAEIKELEFKQARERLMLKEQFVNVYENLKPGNLLKSLISEFSATDKIKNDILDTIVGMGSGYISRKLIVRKSNNPFLKLAGLVVQFGITTLFAKHYSSIQETIIVYLKRFLAQREETKY